MKKEKRKKRKREMQSRERFENLLSTIKKLETKKNKKIQNKLQLFHLICLKTNYQIK